MQQKHDRYYRTRYPVVDLDLSAAEVAATPGSHDETFKYFTKGLGGKKSIEEVPMVVRERVAHWRLTGEDPAQQNSEES